MNYKAKHVLCIYNTLTKIRNGSFIRYHWSTVQPHFHNCAWDPFLTAEQIDVVKASVKKVIAVFILQILMFKFSGFHIIDK